MAQHFANKKSVFAAASALAAEGVRPTILTVRGRLAGGSNGTIRRYLDDWETQPVVQNQHPVDAPELLRYAMKTPEHVLEKSADLGRVLWAMVIREANQYLQASKDASEEQIVALSQALHLAESDARHRQGVETPQKNTLIRPAGAIFQSLAKSSDVRRKAAEDEAMQLADEVKSLRQQVCDLKADLMDRKSEASSSA